MSKHTPGPWHCNVSDGGPSFDTSITAFTKTHRNPIPIGRVYGEGALSNDTDARDANARLIAAAPDGLEANKQAFELLERAYCSMLGSEGWQSDCAAVMGKLRRAIAKTEG